MTITDNYYQFIDLKVSKMLLVNVFLGLAVMVVGGFFLWSSGMNWVVDNSAQINHLRLSENLANGVGFGEVNSSGIFLPDTTLSPFYSLSIAALLRISSLVLPSPAAAGQISRFFGFFITLGTIWAFGQVIARISNRSVIFVALGVVVLVSSPIFWDTFLAAFPGPLFLFLCLLSLNYFLEYIRTFGLTSLFWAGVFVGLSILTFYAGVFLIPAMAVSIFMFTRRPLKKDLLALSHITAVGLLPVFVWCLRNFFTTGAITSDKFAFTAVTSGEWASVYNAFSSWFSPLIKTLKIIPLGCAFLLAVLLLGISIILYYRRRVYGNNESQEKWWRILIIFVTGYLLVLLIFKLFIDPSISLAEAETYIFLHAGLIMIVVSLMANASEIKHIVIGRFLYYASFSVILFFIIIVSGVNFQKAYWNILVGHHARQVEYTPLSLSAQPFAREPAAVS